MFDWRGKKAKINGLPLELQGFSHHPSFAGMGAMTNPRLGLFLVQTTKALGVNCEQRGPQLIVACIHQAATLYTRGCLNPDQRGVRQSGGTPTTRTRTACMSCSLLWASCAGEATAVCVSPSVCEVANPEHVCRDENRNFGSSHTQEYHDMIKSHRHHAAVQIYGLCNEGQCGAEHGAAAAAFMTVKNSLDPERPQNGNMVGDQTYNFPHVDMITESGNAELNGWHEQFPDMPISTGEVRLEAPSVL